MGNEVTRRVCTRDDCDWWVTGTHGPLTAQHLAEHEAQHGPGRALDIAVDWEVSACCSVCEDGIGDVRQDDDGVTCQDCGTHWDIDGTDGHRDEGSR